MRFIKFNYNNSEHCRLIKHNDRFPGEYRADRWYFLIDHNDEIVAECNIHEDRSCWTGHVQSFTICDVYVESRFRGNNFSTLLIVNVMYDMAPVLRTTKLPLLCHTWRKNKAAIKAYYKAFGLPKQISRHLVTFST